MSNLSPPPTLRIRTPAFIQSYPLHWLYRQELDERVGTLTLTFTRHVLRLSGTGLEALLTAIEKGKVGEIVAQPLEAQVPESTWHIQTIDVTPRHTGE